MRTLERLVDGYDAGTIDRRTLLAGIVAAVGATPAIARQSTTATFAATGLDHIALSVTDVARSSAFYQKHLGLRPTSESRGSAFLSCGDQFLALFRSDEPGLAHYSYAIPRYEQSEAAEQLRSVGLVPKLRGNRTYFDDPDGIEVQISRG